MSDLQRSATSDPAFYAALQRRIDQSVRRIARPIRGVMALFSGVGAQFVGRFEEVVPDVETAQHFGFASMPPDGTEAIAVPIGGSSAHLVIVGEIDRTTRPVTDLVLGDAMIYSITGAKVHVKADGSVSITTPAGGAVEIDTAGIVKLNGGGAGVARQGDRVTISATAPSGGGAVVFHSAVISSSSSTVQAGG